MGRSRAVGTGRAGARGWGLLAAYAALLYAAIPFTSSTALRFVATPVGRWLFGRGLVLALLVGTGLVLGWLRQVQAPRRSYVALGVAAMAGLVAFHSLAVRPLERVHLPEYGLAAWLAWRAVRPTLGTGAVAYAVAFIVAAAIGLGEEAIQSVTPGRYFAWHDVGVNALGGALGLLVLDAVRAAERGRSPM